MAAMLVLLMGRMYEITQAAYHIRTKIHEDARAILNFWEAVMLVLLMAEQYEVRR
jgi:hypothetical protein